MQILGLSLLCLTLALLSDTGIGQALGNQRCSDCAKTVQKEDDWLTKAVNMSIQQHKECHGSTIRFTGKNGVTCGKNNLQWVKDITECLKQGIDYSNKIKDCPGCPNCPNCKLIVPNDEDKWKIVAMNLSVQSHDKCSYSIIRFNLNNGAVLCGHNAHQWVQNVIKSLAKDPNPEFFRGASVNPSTATLNPTTIPVTMVMTPTATAQNPNMATSREATEMTRPSKPSVANNGTHNGQQGGKSSSEPFAEHKSEINHMKTTIISLVFIVLVMVAAGTGIFCYKKKLPCLEKPIQYTQAPSQDTLEMGTTTT